MRDLTKTFTDVLSYLDLSYGKAVLALTYHLRLDLDSLPSLARIWEHKQFGQPLLILAQLYVTYVYGEVIQFPDILGSEVTIHDTTAENLALICVILLETRYPALAEGPMRHSLFELFAYAAKGFVEKGEKLPCQ